MKYYLVFPIIFLSYMFFTGCSRNNTAYDSSDLPPVSIKEFDIPPGPDPSVSAEDGGSGFTGAEWTTNNDFHIIGSDKAKKGGTLRLSFHSFPSNYRIIGINSNNEFIASINNVCYETLLDRDPITEDDIPCLATHWQVSNNRLKYKFRLNPYARWADGLPVTTEDVKETFRLIKDSTLLDPAASIFDNFDSLEIQSKYIFTIRAKTANWRDFINLGFGFTILPARYIKGISGKEYIERYNYGFIPGSGPYIIDTAASLKGQKIILRRRNDYWAENEKRNRYLNNFDCINFSFIPDQNLSFEKFKKGDFDVYFVNTNQWNSGLDFEIFKRGIIAKKIIYNESQRTFGGICLNIRRKPLDDINVRKALTYLFNRKMYNEKLYNNSYTLLKSYFSGTEYSNKNNPLIGYSQDSAKMYLEMSGWKKNPYSRYYTKNNEVLEFDISYSSGENIYLSLYQEELKNFGIKLNLRENDQNTLYSLGNEKNFSAIMINWSIPEVIDPEMMFSNSQKDISSSTNWSGIYDPILDSLCKRFNNSFDKHERINIAHSIDSIAVNQFAYIFTWYQPFHKIAFQNKFGYPDAMYYKKSGWNSILSLWFVDYDALERYNKARDNPDITLPVPEIENNYWKSP